jgi:hypothetical protein
VPILNMAPQANTTGNITTATTIILATDLTGVGSAIIQIKGTHAGINMIFEVSPDGGTTFTPINARNINTGALTINGTTGVITSNATIVWQTDILSGYDRFQVRSTAFTSGSGAITIHPSTQFVALPPATQPISGSVTATVASTTVTSLVPGTGSTSLGKAEDNPHTTGDVGVEVLGVRNDTLATVTSATGDYSQISTDRTGAVITMGAPRELKARQVTTLTSTTTETTIVTAIASTFNDIYGLIITNTSTTGTEVTIRDATAGGTISSFYVPPTDTRGFMLPVDSAMTQATVNNNWTAQCGTSVASIKITALYVKRV